MAEPFSPGGLAPRGPQTAEMSLIKINQLLYDGAGAPGGGGSGTVTSVGLSLPSIFSISGSPVTAAGTLTATLATQAANMVFAGPANGAPAAPTFRALVAADMVAAGSDQQVQFNNAGALGANAAFTYSSGTASLGIENTNAGTLILFDELGSASGKVTFHDNASGFITELSVATLTASRTVNLPDATGTIALVESTASLGANTFTRLQTITQGTANEGILASTGYSLTGADATSMINLAGTWNTTGGPSAIKLNITNTASHSSSKLLDLQVGSTSLCYVGVDGTANFDFTGDLRFLQAGTSGLGRFRAIWRTASLHGWFEDANGNSFLRFGKEQCAVDVVLGFGSSGNAAGPDTFLSRDAANVLAVKNTTNAQTFRVYGNTTGSHYLNLTHNGTNAAINVNGGGTLLISSLPTANPGAGILWNNAGTPAIGT